MSEKAKCQESVQFLYVETEDAEKLYASEQYSVHD